MRKLLIVAALVIGCSGTVAVAQTSVRGYVRKDGTYVAPHVRTAPNSSRLDNYSTKPNYNPYTGKEGTVDPYAVPAYRPYSPPRAPSIYQPYSNPYAVKPVPAPCYGYGC